MGSIPTSAHSCRRAQFEFDTRTSHARWFVLAFAAMELPVRFDAFGPLQTEGLEIRRGGVDSKGVGLFTTRSFVAGDAIGFYAGIPRSELTKQEERFAIDIGGFDVAVVPPLDSMGGVDFNIYPMAAANEPCVGVCANMVLAGDRVYEVDGTPYVVLAFYASADVEAGMELTWHYGPRYDRCYQVGRLSESTPEIVMTMPRLKRLLEHRPDAIFSISELGSV